MAAGRKPKWLVRGDALTWPLIGMAASAAWNTKYDSLDIRSFPELAIYHHAGCLETSMSANMRGKHSAAICLVRQSVEALTISDVSMQNSTSAAQALDDWKSGRKTHGQMRAWLEENAWPKYGSGLWDEPWSQFYANLARSVQPCAHYTVELQGWQFVTVDYQGGTEPLTTFGLKTYDALQASRITLFHMLMTWMLGRILLISGLSEDAKGFLGPIQELGQALANSKLLFRGGEWSSQLAPHMLFQPGVDWRDD